MINKSEQTLDNRLVEEIAYMRRELNALKTRQLLGGDNMVVGRSNQFSGDIVVGAGQTAILHLNVTTGDGAMTMMQVGWSLYLYGIALPDPVWLFPSGSSVSSAICNEIHVDWREDWSLSDDDTGLKSFILTIHNSSGASSRTFLFTGRVYSPKRQLS